MWLQSRADKDSAQNSVFSVGNWQPSKTPLRGVTISPLEQQVIQELMQLHEALCASVNGREFENSDIWSMQLRDGGLTRLISALARQDENEASYLLGNFWAVSQGQIGATYNSSVQTRRATWSAAHKTRGMFHRASLLRPLSSRDACVASMHGNPMGFKYEGSVINANSVRHTLDAREIAALATTHKTVLEIGGGHGSLVAKTLQFDPTLHYIDCDLIEMLLVAYYFLRLTFPEQMIKFIRNFDDAQLLPQYAQQFNVVLLPNVFKAALSRLKVDVVFNSYSFAEMSASEMRDYADHIKRSTARFVLHENYVGRSTGNGLLSESDLTFEGFSEVARRWPLDLDSENCLRLLLQRS